MSQKRPLPGDDDFLFIDPDDDEIESDDEETDELSDDEASDSSDDVRPSLEAPAGATPPTMPRSKPKKGQNWESLYRAGTPPWDFGKPAPELVKIIRDKVVPVGTVLELGCGTGANAIFLANAGFDVTAVDISAIALERAHVRKERQDALVRFVHADVFQFAPTAGTFDLVIDSGFYAPVRQYDLDRLLDLLWRVTKPGSYYFMLGGRPPQGSETTDENGPPIVTEDEIYDELGRLFDIEQLQPTIMGSPRRKEGYPGWACLMHRPKIELP